MSRKQRPHTNTLNGRRVRAVPRLYDPAAARETPGAWWYPDSATTVTLKCSRTTGGEHTFRLKKDDFDGDGVLLDDYTHVSCLQGECDSDLGRVWLVDFDRTRRVDPAGVPD